MTKTTVVTGFNPEGYELYGKGFLKSFDRFWPPEVGLIYYTEEKIKPPIERGEQRSLWDIPGVRTFIDEHDKPLYHGKEITPEWTKKEGRAAYAWRYDVVRFCRQLFIPDHAANTLPDGDILAWFDADVVTFKEVPGKLAESCLVDKTIVTIGRDRGCTDIGFWAVRLVPGTRALLKRIADSYRNGYVFTLYEWHSGFLFDHWVEKFKIDGLITHRSLTHGSGHVWFDCEIGKYTDHLKGPQRKVLGYSPERGRDRRAANDSKNQPW